MPLLYPTIATTGIAGTRGDGGNAMMYPPSQTLNLSIEAISGITGSVSIACWLVVFTPQIIENFKRKSAEGLSLTFLVLWLLGDIFNVLGAILQGVIPTMLILAIYYTFADIVLLIQCLYYRSIQSRKAEAPLLTNQDAPTEHQPGEESPLLSRVDSGTHERRDSMRMLAENAHHLSPANPLHDQLVSPTASIHGKGYTNGHSNGAGSSTAVAALRNVGDLDRSTLAPKNQNGNLWKTIYHNTIAVSIVILAGVFGYYLTPSSQKATDPEESKPIEFSLWGQIFGYFCAVLYLGSRIPQIVLNYKRKSCEGVAFLFFLFACLGNTTYVISILAYQPGKGEGEGYWRYLAVNASWLAGSLGTLFLDFLIFVQFFLYRTDYFDSDFENAIISDDDDEETIIPSSH